MNVVFHLRDGRRVFDSNGNPDVALEILGGVLRRSPDDVLFNVDGGLIRFPCRDVERVEIELTGEPS